MTAAKHMYMQVVDELTGVDSLVDSEAVTTFSGAKLASDPGTNTQQVPQQWFVLFGRTREIGDVFARDYQGVDVGERVDVVEREALVVRIDLGRWQFAVDDLAKQAVGLTKLILFFFCSPPHKSIPYKPMALASFAL